MPALLNMNGISWEEGVRELVEVAYLHFPMLPTEDLQLCLYDRAIQRCEVAFLNFIKDKPRMAIVILGERLPDLLAVGVESLPDASFDCILSLFNSRPSLYLTSALTRLLIGEEFGELLRRHGTFQALLESYRGTIEAIAERRLLDRDWEALWLLARVCRSAGVVPKDVPMWLQGAATTAVRDIYGRMQFHWEADAEWWAECIGIEISQVRMDLKEEEDKEGRELWHWGSQDLDWD